MWEITVLMDLPGNSLSFVMSSPFVWMKSWVYLPFYTLPLYKYANYCLINQTYFSLTDCILTMDHTHLMLLPVPCSFFSVPHPERLKSQCNSSIYA